MRIEGSEKLLSIIPSKKFGVYCEFGTIFLGETNFGDSDLYLHFSKNDSSILGDDSVRDPILLSGFYRTTHREFGLMFQRMKFYIPKDPRTPNQIALRNKFASAVHAWQNLTKEEKMIYNKRARNKKYFGYHLFLREYMLSSG